ncbi:MAG: PAS domain S-box protein [Deltaproteobacteria bacterium]|nr:PAS domain S-box protein [Deltaproteobacteria bacterium]
MQPIFNPRLFVREGKPERSEISAVRQTIFERLLYIFSLIGLLAVVTGAIEAFLQGKWYFSSLYAGIYLLFLLVTFGSRRISYKTRAVVLVCCLYLIALAVLVRIGLSGVGTLILVGVCFLSAVFFGLRGGIIAIFLSLASMGLVGAGMTTGIIEIYPDHMLTSLSLMAWITFLFVFFMITSVTVLAPEMFSLSIEHSLDLIEEHKIKLEINNQHLLLEIEERKKMEEALRAGERKYRSVIENIQDVFYRLDKKGKLVMTSPSGARMFGYTFIEEMNGLPLEHFMPDAHERQALMEKLKKNGSVNDFEAVMRRTDGSTFTASITVHFYYDDTGDPKGTEGIIRDITERRQAQEERKRLSDYLDNIINSMPSLLVGVDREGRVSQWNLAAEKTTGICAEKARGQNLEHVLPMLGRELENVQEAIRNKSVRSEVKVPRQTEGVMHYDDITVYPLVTNGVEGAVIRVDDVTERVRMEEMMIQSEKMLSVGGLAAGMAHEINNPLGVILQASQNVLRRVSPDLPANSRIAEECGTTLSALRTYLERREIPEFLDDIRKSGERAAGIVSNMLSFSRKADGRGTPADMGELLDQTLDLAGSDYDLKKKYDFRKIEIVREYDPEVPKAVCQTSKIQQVFLNILRNGAEAMQEQRARAKEHGIKVLTPRFTLRVMREGEMVRVEIEDNGPGMDEATRKRVFEPFFTTKAPGVGTGLGLSVSYFIIAEEHRGTLSIESNPGMGAMFVVRLPVEGGSYGRGEDPNFGG